MTLAVALAAAVFLVSQLMVSPPRPRVSESSRPVLGLVLCEDEHGLTISASAAAAGAAGLRAGDFIVTFDDQPVRSLSHARAFVADREAGEAVRVEAARSAPDGRSAVLVDIVVEHTSLSPADLGLAFETVEFAGGAGVTLRGWFLPAPGGVRAPTVIYGHGNGADRTHWFDFLRPLHDAGFAQLAFDFAGRGESDGDVITLGLTEADDLASAIFWLVGRDEVDAGNLFLAGRSMGAAAAILAAADGPPLRGLVLDSSFADLAGLVDDLLTARYVPAWPLRPLAFQVAGWRAGFEPHAVVPAADMASIVAPVLLIHGTEDRLVPPEHAEQLAAAAAGPVELMWLPGSGHNDERSQAIPRVRKFLLEHTRPPRSSRATAGGARCRSL